MLERHHAVSELRETLRKLKVKQEGRRDLGDISETWICISSIRWRMMNKPKNTLASGVRMLHRDQQKQNEESEERHASLQKEGKHS